MKGNLQLPDTGQAVGTTIDTDVSPRPSRPSQQPRQQHDFPLMKNRRHPRRPASPTLVLSYQDQGRLLISAVVAIIAGFVVCAWAISNAILAEGGLVIWFELSQGVLFMLLALVAFLFLQTTLCATCCRPAREKGGSWQNRGTAQEDALDDDDEETVQILTGPRVDIIIEGTTHTLIAIAMIGFLLQFYVADLSILYAPVHLGTLFCPVLAVVLCKKWWGSIFWSILTAIAIVFGGFVFEVLDGTNRLAQSDRDLLNSSLLRRFLSLYTCTCAPFFISLVAFLYVHFMREREQGLTLKVAKAISRLQFDDPSIQKLKNKPLKSCSETEMVLRETLRNMIMYARYLPENLKVEASEDAKDLLTAADGNVSDKPSVSSSGVSESGSVVSVDSSRVALAEKPSGHHLKNRAAFRVGLMARRVGTVLVADVRSMHSLLMARDDSKEVVHHQFNDFVDSFVRIVKRTGGVVEGIQGDKCVATWNSIRNCVTHQQNATVCAHELLSVLEGQQSNESSLRVVFCISSGEMLQGNVGNEVKRCVTLGWPCSLVFGMKRLIAVGLNPPASVEGVEAVACGGGTAPPSSVIYVDGNVRHLVKWAFATRIVSIVQHQGRVTEIHRLGKKLLKEEGKNKEWMYAIAGHLQQRRGEEEEGEGEVASGAGGDFDKAWKKLWRGIARGDPSESVMEISKELPDLSRTSRDSSDAETIRMLLESSQGKCIREW